MQSVVDLISKKASPKVLFSYKWNNISEYVIAGIWYADEILSFWRRCWEKGNLTQVAE